MPKRSLSVFLIAQLAVDCRQRGKGLGKIMLVKALEYLWKVNAYMRAYAVVVDCLTEKAQPFYAKYGFRSLGTCRGHERLFLPLKTVAGLTADGTVQFTECGYCRTSGNSKPTRQFPF